MPSRDYKVLVVGLDGATFDLMLPWVKARYLPNLGKLLQHGAHSRLESTIPPITPCAWSSFMTGKNPGKHGLFDFIEPLPDSGGFQFTNASFRVGETLWGCLSRHGRRVGVVNVPMTFPPEPVEGFLISGLDTPHERSDFMYPAMVRSQLKKAGIRYRIDQQHLGNMRSDTRRRRQLNDIFAAETARTKAFTHLSELNPADFGMIVYGATDQVQHHFWHYMDQHHDKYDRAGAATFRNAIRDTYIHIDGLLGSLLKRCGDDTIVVVMSDHGFGPTTAVRLRLNQVLQEAGVLAFDHAPRRQRLRRSLVGWLDGLLRSTLSPDVKRTLAGLFPKLRVWFENLDEAKIDWRRTSAYVNEAYRSSPAVWLKLPPGSPENRAAELLFQIQNALESLVDPATGEPVISACHRPKEIYHGPLTAKAPDLLPSWWEDGFLLAQSLPRDGRAPNVERSTTPIEGGVEFAGSHRLDGVFIATGGPVRCGAAFADARIIDVAPTILYLMGIPVPEDMDGRILTEALDPNFVDANPPKYEYVDSNGDRGSESETQSFTENESQLIARRLQALGYIN